MVTVGELTEWPEGDIHIRNLGRLVALLHTLEISLRFYLGMKNGESFAGLPKGVTPYNFEIGEELPASELTNFDSLRVLIDRFNLDRSKANLPGVKEDIIELRNAIAHGIVSGIGKDGEMQLIKFSAPQDGKVTVQYKARMDAEWFEKQIKAVNEAAHLVCTELASTNN